MSITNLNNGLSSNDKKCPACGNPLNVVYTEDGLAIEKQYCNVCGYCEYRYTNSNSCEYTYIDSKRNIRDYTLGEIIDICTSHKKSCVGCPFYLKPDCAFLNLPAYWRLEYIK